MYVSVWGPSPSSFTSDEGKNHVCLSHPFSSWLLHPARSLAQNQCQINICWYPATFYTKCSRSSYWTSKRNSWINAGMVTATMRTGVTLQRAPFCIWLTLSYQSTEISRKHPQWANLYVLRVMQNSQVTVFGWKVKGSIRIAGHGWADCTVPRGPNGGEGTMAGILPAFC